MFRNVYVITALAIGIPAVLFAGALVVISVLKPPPDRSDSTPQPDLVPIPQTTPQPEAPPEVTSQKPVSRGEAIATITGTAPIGYAIQVRNLEDKRTRERLMTITPSEVELCKLHIKMIRSHLSIVEEYHDKAAYAQDLKDWDKKLKGNLTKLLDDGSGDYYQFARRSTCEVRP